MLHSFADDGLGQTVGVGVRCVPGVYTQVIRLFEEGKGLRFGESPRGAFPVRVAKGHASEDYARDFEGGGAESVLGLLVSHDGTEVDIFEEGYTSRIAFEKVPVGGTSLQRDCGGCPLRLRCRGRRRMLSDIMSGSSQTFNDLALTNSRPLGCWLVTSP